MMRSLFFFLAAAQVSRAGLVIAPAGLKTAEFSWSEKSVVGLSGLAWGGKDRYYAVSDRLQALVPLRMTINKDMGMIQEIKMEPLVPVKTRFQDFEDIVCDAAGGRVFISAEGPPGIAGFGFDGKALPPVTLPEVFLTARPNLSMEALTRDAASGRVWTANEDTLPGDGEVASRSGPGVVRLQEFDAKWKPLRQFAWRTEKSTLRVHGSGTGVSGLCLLPDGSLLVMERVIAGFGLEVHLSLADFSGATDTSKMPALAGVEYSPAKKVLLFQKNTGLTNYEGIALGPVLNDGSRSLILVADSGESEKHSFLALTVAGMKK